MRGVDVWRAPDWHFARQLRPFPSGARGILAYRVHDVLSAKLVQKLVHRCIPAGLGPDHNRNRVC